MKSNPVFLLLACGLGLLPISFCTAAADVKLSELVSGAQLGDDVVVQVPDDTLLIIDGSSPYFLEGRNLFIRAKRGLIRGTPSIHAFSDPNTGAAVPDTPSTPSPAPDGAVGAKGLSGASGTAGTAAGVCVLDIASLSAEAGASLLIRFSGQIGSPGQRGGQGGQGGSGATGRNAASDFPSCSRPCPDRGGKGLQGGARGSGGQGGPGGAGGLVYVSPSVRSLTSGPSVKIVVDGGAGGASGAVGERGIGGGGGVRGAGGNCQCKDVPGPGPDGDAGPDSADATPPSTRGPAGELRNL